MKNFYASFIVVIFIVFIGCAEQVDIEVEKQNVKTVLDQFIQASENENMELLSQIFAHDPDIISFGTEANERIVGWDKLRELMQNQFEATENSKLTVMNQVIKVHNSGKVAWFSEIIDWSLLSQDQEIILEGLRATGILEKREGRWVMVQLHYSVPADSQAAQE
ncbi:nuclear transport factor 2 family protein [bacterium]|nr:nuclear transport factor 2 family protein [bacterium]